MRTTYDDGTWSEGQGVREMLSLGVEKRMWRAGAAHLASGARLTTKGQTVSGPSYFIEYVEAPVVVSLYRDAGFSPYLAGSVVSGLRAYCNPGPARYAVSCSDDGLRWWEVSWELSAGVRLVRRTGALRVSASYAESLSDIERVTRGRAMNRVWAVRLAFERLPSVGR